jgi:chemotaxis protein MotB
MADVQPIIIKKISKHGGHHGGAWKVAYADFVTAMMSLFIVLWLMSTTSKYTQEAIGGYFRDPNGSAKVRGTTKQGVVENTPKKKEDLNQLKQTLMKSIQNIDALNKLKKQIEITITDEGLRIELIEDKKGTFFETGSPKPTPILVELLKVLSAQLGKIPNKISVEGHTDAMPYSSTSGYGNWELSADRANMARHLMQDNGVGANQIAQVRGFADQNLRKPDQPFDASNRRISLIVQYLDMSKMPAGIVAPADQPALAPAFGGPPAKSNAGKDSAPTAASKPSPGVKPAGK